MSSGDGGGSNGLPTEANATMQVLTAVMVAGTFAWNAVQLWDWWRQSNQPPEEKDCFDGIMAMKIDELYEHMMNVRDHVERQRMQLEHLYDWHNKDREDGTKVWYCECGGSGGGHKQNHWRRGRSRSKGGSHSSSTSSHESKVSSKKHRRRRVKSRHRNLVSKRRSPASGSSSSPSVDECDYRDEKRPDVDDRSGSGSS